MRRNLLHTDEQMGYTGHIEDVECLQRRRRPSKKLLPQARTVGRSRAKPRQSDKRPCTHIDGKSGLSFSTSTSGSSGSRRQPTPTPRTANDVAPKIRGASPWLAGILATQACVPSQRKGQEVKTPIPETHWHRKDEVGHKNFNG